MTSSCASSEVFSDASELFFQTPEHVQTTDLQEEPLKNGQIFRKLVLQFSYSSWHTKTTVPQNGWFLVAKGTTKSGRSPRDGSESPSGGKKAPGDERGRPAGTALCMSGTPRPVWKQPRSQAVWVEKETKRIRGRTETLFVWFW